ncbi:UNVERIFIED_CONTAM: hypothetical protein ABIC26_000576 [Paenibacillus sp. PvR008]
MISLSGAVASFGFGMVEAIIGTIVISGITEGTGAAMSRLEVFFGIGALAMPAVASQLIAFDWWRLAFPVISVAERKVRIPVRVRPHILHPRGLLK